MKRSLLQSLNNAFHGLSRLLREERNVRIHLITAVCALSAGVYLRFSAIELSIVCLTCSVVIAGELFNAALERYSDIVKPRVSGYVEQVKDISAASVLVLACMSLLVGLLLYVPKIIERFF